MRKMIILVFVIFSLVLFSNVLTVYTYDSFVSGIGQKVIPVFEKMYGCKVNLLSFGDAGAVLSRLIFEKQNPRADIIIGLDQALLKKAVDNGLIEKYTPININLLKYPEFLNEFAVPYDFGSIALVYNKEKVKNPPKSFQDLLKSEYKGKIVVEDPRTSSTGLSFLLWTIAVYKDKYLDFWNNFKKNILSITPGWDEAFEMLESGEADIMVSYATDGAYSYYYYNSVKFVPIILSEGAFVQVEYASLVKNSKNKELAKRFLEFILMEEFQKEIPLNQWMFPVTDVKLPEAFQYVPKIGKILEVDNSIYEKLEEILKKWSKVVIGG